MASVIIPAGGMGRRMNSNTPKAFLPLAGRPILYHTLKKIHSAGLWNAIVIAVPAGKMDAARRIVRELKCDNVTLVEGGLSRRKSVAGALEAVPIEEKFVVVHDAARPFASVKLFENTLAASRKTGAATAALPSIDTLKVVKKGCALETLDRQAVWLVQTPQAFRTDVLRRAHEMSRNKTAPDDASMVEDIGVRVRIAPGERWNFKITEPEDLEAAEALMKTFYGKARGQTR